MIYDNILGTIGRTPIVKLQNLIGEDSAEIYCKLESFNPMSSVKDRIALAMIEDAEKSGRLKKGMTVVEPTSGNTGIGLAMVCAVKGYRLILTMPESMSIERRKLLKAFGAELILTPAEEGMNGAVIRAKEILKENDNCFMPQQFENPSNPEVHMKTTAREILNDVPDLDAFVAGVGTGGTITGVGKVLKSTKPNVKIVAVEPFRSAVLSGSKPGPHQIQGIGAGFIPKVLDLSVIDRIITVKDEEAKSMVRELVRKEGIFAGISSGAALHAALKIGRELGPRKKVVVILPDTGERYLSTDMFSE
ncbi:MAG: cysteine synthase A [Methanomassiliicoccales archaeon]|jgi:cysteine synthase A|nr:cysteine synthase A [Methanomassiliicoccales archaeon]